MSPSTINSSRPFQPARLIFVGVILGIIVATLGQAWVAPASTAETPPACTVR